MNFIKILEHHLLDHSIGVNFPVAGWNIPVTKHELMMVIASVLLMVFLPLAARRWPMVPHGGRNLLESLVVFIRDEVVIANMGEEGRPYVPYFLTTFFFILAVGLLGMVPGAATATGNISVTATLAFFTFALINIAGIRKFGLYHHVKNFIPHGLPVWLVPLMLPLEIAGLITRSFALCIRLFANMIAGHIVILAFLSLIFIFGSFMVSIPAEAAAVGLSLLEVFVVFLQAYIFTLLSSIFVGASLHPH